MILVDTTVLVEYLRTASQPIRAIRAGLEVWTYDAHFSAIQGALPALRLFAGPQP